ncbi:MAG: helix-turn-helix domain-containing protein [Chloroflexi bacterium]|nr:helix-turn-helix domain-containing protein [Chloroflexota bacterium]
MNSLQNDLRRRRVQAGLSQQELAGRAGISRQAFAAVESGRATPSTSVALRLARALNTTVENLFSLANDLPPVMEAELAGSTPLSNGNESDNPRRASLTPVGNRLLARPLTDSMSSGYGSARYGLVAADGMILSGGGGRSNAPNTVMVQPFDQEEMQTPCVSLLGCDPAVGILEAGLRQRGVRLAWVEEGSLQALAGLSRGEAHIAGCHLRDEATGRYNHPWAQRMLPFDHTLIAFATWQQGLMVAARNPKGITGIEHLDRADLSIVNRPSGSGSRNLLDRLLAAQGIPAESVQGYDRELRGHLEVAAAVASGLADAGIGVHAAASAMGLDFLPLEEERYDLVIPNHFLDVPAVQALLDLLRMPSVQRKVETLAGYDISGMGIPVSVN